MEDIPLTVAELRHRMDTGLGHLFTALDEVDQSRLAKAVDPNGWSVRDHMAHMATWADGIAALLSGQSRWQAMGLDITDDDRQTLGSDGINAMLVDRHRHLEVVQAREWLLEAHERVAGVLEGLNDEELMRPYGSFLRPPADTGKPIFGYVIGNTFGHYEEHTGWIRELFG